MLFRYCSGDVGNTGFASHAFHHKGVVYVPVQQGDDRPDLGEEAATDLAIDVEAEEVERTVDDGNVNSYQVSRGGGWGGPR